MTAVAVVAYVGLSLAALATVVRLVRGPTVPDRIVALDNLLFTVVMAIAVGAATQGTGRFLSLLVAVALVSFVGTVTVARFVERRGSA